MPPKGKRNSKKKETSHVEKVENITREEATAEATTTTDKDKETVIDQGEDEKNSSTTVDPNSQTETNQNAVPSKTDHRETETTATSSNSNNNNSSSSGSSLNDRLFALRMKINQSRKQNLDDVEEEYNRLTGKRKNNNPDKSSNPVDGEDETYDRSSKKTAKAGTKTEADLLQTTAEDSEWQTDKRRRKEEIAATYGMSAFTSDANYRAYEKRVSKLTPTADTESNPALAENPLDYGRVNTAVSAEALDRLSKDVIAREAARKKFSRSKVGENSGDIDYINEKNRQFNKKLRHAFDKYTVEIRQNLERGTAL